MDQLMTQYTGFEKKPHPSHLPALRYGALLTHIIIALSLHSKNNSIKIFFHRQEFDRAADRYNQDIDRMTEKLQNIHFQYEKAKTEKEKTELQSLKLSRDLERATEELMELREARGIAENKDIETRNETERMAKTLEEVKILDFF